MGPDEPIKKHDFKMEDEKQDIVDNLKSNVNNFLFQKCPGPMTLDEFEELSIKVHDLIFKEWEKFL